MQNELMSHRSRLLFVVIYAVAAAFMQAAAVIYLRELFYPEGFALSSQAVPVSYVRIEVMRELCACGASVVVAVLAGRGVWEIVGWFLTISGIGDVFYYIWLKAAVGWPESLFTWDVLSLIPVPWVGPVIAPIAIGVFMIVIGALITILHARGYRFRPTGLAWAAAALATVVVLLSFWSHADTTLETVSPGSYPYWMLLLGLALYLVGFWHTWHASTRGE